MAQKSKGIEQLLDLPWRLSASLGVVVYVALKYVLPAIPFENPLLLGFSRAATSLAGVVALVFLFAAALSFFLQIKKGRLVDSQTGVDSIRGLSWKDFEFLISEAFRRQGYTVKENLHGGADGGIDLVLHKNSETTLVQCKNWKNSSVGVTVVRELFGVVQADRADRGLLVCSGRFTSEAKAFATKSGIQLLGQDELSDLLRSVQKEAQFAAPPKKSPGCPLCGSEMVQRTAKRGQHSSKAFWGCSTYPRCRGTL